MSRTTTYPYSSVTFEYAPGSFKSLAESPLGVEVWEFLTRPYIVHAMAVAVDVGAAPVAAISFDLLHEFGSGAATSPPLVQLADGLAKRFPQQAQVKVDRLKQMIGHMIRQILEAVGYTLRALYVPTHDKFGVFKTSARYE
jgi:hypothetical protein